MNNTELIIPGEPVGKGRPIFNRWMKTARTPEKTAAYEKYVKELYVYNRFPKFEGYICMEITAYYRIPKSANKKNKLLMANNEILPAKVPDVDNIAKIICDSLNGIAYGDDKQIVSLSIKKFYSEQPRVIVQLKNI